MSPNPPAWNLRCRSAFISDIHLGFKGCRATELLDFLRRIEVEQLYLVGDIVDLWALKRRFYWPEAHNDVLRAIVDKARHGTRVAYLPGNHDRTLRDHDGWVLGRIELVRETIHETADGRRFLVLHGDEFDTVIRASPWLEWPCDVVLDGVTGALSEDLEAAAIRALTMNADAWLRMDDLTTRFAALRRQDGL